MLSWNKLLDTTSSGLWFTYGNASRLRIARNSSDPNTTTRQLNYDYDYAGNRTSDRNYNPNGMIGNGVSDSYGINVLNQVESQTVTSGGGSLKPQGVFFYVVGDLTYDGGGKTFEGGAANKIIAIKYAGRGKRNGIAFPG